MFVLVPIITGFVISQSNNLNNNKSVTTTTEFRKNKYMKKVLLTLALTAVCAASFAQGKINMVNDASHLVQFGTAVKAPDAALAGQLATSAATPSGATLLVDLFGGTTAGNMTLQQTTILGIGPSAGFFGPRTFSSLDLPGGVTATFQVKVREVGFATAELAQAGGAYYGFSPVFTFRPSSTIAFNSIVNPGGTALSTWAAGPINVQVVPEPSSMALAGIGAASLLMFRRRK